PPHLLISGKTLRKGVPRTPYVVRRRHRRPEGCSEEYEEKKNTDNRDGNIATHQGLHDFQNRLEYSLKRFQHSPGIGFARGSISRRDGRRRFLTSGVSLLA